MAGDHNPPPPTEETGGEPALPSAPASPDLRLAIQEKCWQSLGLERDGPALGELLAWLDGPGAQAGRAAADRAGAETRNLADVARAMARSALFREESRGAHFRTDFPRPDDARFRGHTLVEGDAVRLVDVEAPVAVSA